MNLAKALRKRNGLSQKQVAEKINISAKTYRKHEYHFDSMPLYTFMKLCDMLGYELRGFELGYGLQKVGGINGWYLVKEWIEDDFHFTEIIRYDKEKNKEKVAGKAPSEVIKMAGKNRIQR